MGHRSVARRHAAVRRDAEAAARRLHPPRRHDLRRPAAANRRSTLDDGSSGATSSPKRSRGRRRRSTISGAAIATTCRTSICGASTPRCRRWRSGTITRCATTGSRRSGSTPMRASDEKSVALLAARAKRAFLDYLPLRINPIESERIYRAWRHGPALEIFALDMRSYRGAELGQPADRAERGDRDSRRRAGRVARSARWRRRTATWKVIASDMPLGVVVPDAGGRFEAVANRDDGAPLGRELEIARVAEVHQGPRIRNVVWITRTCTTAPRITTTPTRALHRVRSVLGVRRRPAARRHLRSERAGSRRSGRR